MAAVQATIPFKHRKKTFLSDKLSKTDENKDILNTLPLNGKTSKRRLKKSVESGNT